MPVVVLDEILHARILKEIEGSDFKTPDDYVIFVLKEVFGMPDGTSEAIAAKEIEASLKKLGYM